MSADAAQRPTPFGQRLQAAVAECGPVVAGIDPHLPLLEKWGLPATADGAREMGLRVIETVQGTVAAVKPQAAFFERFGSAGVAALEEVLAAARAAGILSILDVKRGDIGSTMDAYAAAHLEPGAPAEADAITASPYLGFGALRPAIDLARSHGKGVFILALTSNPDGATVQHARDADGVAVARRIAEAAGAENARDREQETAGAGDDGVSQLGWGSVGLVVGATIGSAAQDLGIDLAATRSPLLAPGFGAQGAQVSDIPRVFGPAAPQVLVSVSRGLLSAGPDAGDLRAAAAALRAEYTRI